MLIDQRVALLGIRHHGPGSAASLIQALNEFEPELILMEGAPETEALAQYVADPDLRPPVAQLVYATDHYQDSVVYPFTEYSPEWQVLHYAHRHQLPLRCIDLPQAHSLALSRQQRDLTQTDTAETQIDNDNAATKPASTSNLEPSEDPGLDSLNFRRDPLDWLAQAAGYADGERWWEALVEQHPQGLPLFAVIAEAMTELRQAIEAEQPLSSREALREAWMRLQLQQAMKQTTGKIAVICGAWHVPALAKKVAVKTDQALVKGLPKLKLQATWIPWTDARIAYQSGYGAGVQAPGWYRHLWRAHQQGLSHTGISVSWLSQAAQILRAKGFDVAPASVIDAVRLVQALAALRDRPLPSLDEMQQAIQSLFCFGDDQPLALLQQPLWIGESLGQVPANLPKVPLQADCQARQKSCRLTPSAVEQRLELDLRKDSDRARSVLLHQLQLLDIGWGEKQRGTQGKGTFKEVWQLQWQPEFEVRLIEHSLWGNSLPQAASAKILSELKGQTRLTEISNALDRLLLADLPQAVQQLLAQLQKQLGLVPDLDELMQALPKLVSISRYGDVRGTDHHSLHQLIRHFCSRIQVGLLAHCRQLDDDAASQQIELLVQISDALKLQADAELLAQWWQALQQLTAHTDLHPLILGRSYRLLLLAEFLSAEQVAHAFSFALSSAVDPTQAAYWIEGLLQGSGLLLIHDTALWQILDAYLLSLSNDRFCELLPLLRRTCASFNRAERDNLKRKAQSGQASQSPDADHSMDEAALALMLPAISAWLGLDAEAV